MHKNSVFNIIDFVSLIILATSLHIIEIHIVTTIYMQSS